MIFQTFSVEDPQGLFTDDTALNQIILYCCDLWNIFIFV